MPSSTGLIHFSELFLKQNCRKLYKKLNFFVQVSLWSWSTSPSTTSSSAPRRSSSGGRRRTRRRRWRAEGGSWRTSFFFLRSLERFRAPTDKQKNTVPRPPPFFFRPPADHQGFGSFKKKWIVDDCFKLLNF